MQFGRISAVGVYAGFTNHLQHRRLHGEGHDHARRPGVGQYRLQVPQGHQTDSARSSAFKENIIFHAAPASQWHDKGLLSAPFKG